MVPLVKAADETGSNEEPSRTYNLVVFMRFLYMLKINKPGAANITP